MRAHTTTPQSDKPPPRFFSVRYNNTIIINRNYYVIAVRRIVFPTDFKPLSDVHLRPFYAFHHSYHSITRRRYHRSVSFHFLVRSVEVPKGMLTGKDLLRCHQPFSVGNRYKSFVANLLINSILEFQTVKSRYSESRVIEFFFK